MDTKMCRPAASRIWCWRDTSTRVYRQTSGHTVRASFEADVQIGVATLAIHPSPPLFAPNASVAWILFLPISYQLPDELHFHCWRQTLPLCGSAVPAHKPTSSQTGKSSLLAANASVARKTCSSPRTTNFCFSLTTCASWAHPWEVSLVTCSLTATWLWCTRDTTSVDTDMWLRCSCRLQG